MLAAAIFNIQNLDLLTVGIAVAGMSILGVIVLFNNIRSISNRIFFYLALAASTWSIINYSFYQISSPQLSFWFLRFVMFLAVWFAFAVFSLLYVFPREDIKFPKYYWLLLFPLTIVTSILTLTPLVLSEVVEFSLDGGIEKVTNGPGIILFGLLVSFLNIGGIALLVKKILHSQSQERKPLRIVLVGIIITLFFILTFNFIFPAFLDNPQYIPLGAVFIFPFIAFTAYAIYKHHLLNIKVIATETLTFLLTIVIFYEVLFAENFTIRIFRSGVFLLVLSFGILLIRSVRKEVEQREKLQKLSEDLSAANEKLTALDKLKSEFLSFASHQVKSPMAVVKGFAELIADGTYGQVSDEAKEKAKKIKENADRTLALVNNLLDLGKIEEGKMEFTFTQVDIVKMAKDMVEEYKVIASGKGLDMQFESSSPSLTIRADEQKIRQVLQNVIDNSIKYTQAGFIKISVQEEGDYATIAVTDSGRGMSQELLKKLFGRFVRDEKTKAEIQGTGLGLYIAKQIVDAHHGKIYVESDGEGKGSRFYIRLAK